MFIFLILLSNSYSAELPYHQSIEEISKQFLGVPYVLDPLGEGKHGSIDTDPLYRFDQFDCTTYVETVIALSRSKTQDEFAKNMNEIRYSTGEPDYFKRNHFIEVDWMPSNIQKGIVEDVTAGLFDSKILKTAHTKIDKRSWYKQKKKTSPVGEKPIPVTLTYLPLDQIIDHPKLLDQIPSGTFFNLIKVKSHSLGLVVHQGVLVRNEGILLARHATKLSRDQVVEMNALGLFRMYFRNQESEGVKSAGLNFFKKLNSL
ncbi:MAG: DUF1460 domain-containing protein [Xanthomonadaceae bacterium]|nr:DUF1460 domain-containing protein [Xanthomonadaceae bacterium]